MAKKNRRDVIGNAVLGENVEPLTENDTDYEPDGEIVKYIEARLEIHTPYLVKASEGCTVTITNRGTGSLKVLELMGLAIHTLLAGESIELAENDFYLKSACQPFFLIEYVKKG